MDISNRTLGLLLVAAIVVSIGSTFFMLNSITSAPGFTGYATDNASGDVKLALNSTVSITTPDSTIDFGTCRLNTSASSGYTDYDSNVSYPSLCSNASVTNFAQEWNTTDYLLVENDGGIDVNITVKTNQTAAQTYKGVNGALTNTMYMVKAGQNETDSCVSSGLNTTYTNLSSTSTEHTLCSVLHHEDNQDSLKVFAKIRINNSATPSNSTSQVKWTFTAEAN